MSVTSQIMPTANSTVAQSSPGVTLVGLSLPALKHPVGLGLVVSRLSSYTSINGLSAVTSEASPMPVP